MKKPFVERRKSQRVEVRVPVKLEEKFRGEAIPGESANLGEGGVYCNVEKYLPPLTKVAITLMLPGFGEVGGKPQQITADAVVVRTIPEKQDRKVDKYRIACSFTSMNEEHKEIVREYIIWRLLSRLGDQTEDLN